MSTALQDHSLTNDQIDLIKTQIAVGCTNDELKLFMYTCARTGLDPMARQIYAIKRNTKRGPVMTIQTGIDGYRLIADRTGKYAGSDEPQFVPEGNDRKAIVTVYKMVEGTRCPFVGVAYWSEYRPDNGNQMWEKMPRTMLAKCAEALALRKAFPNELSGLYTKEEMDQASDSEVGPPTVVMTEPKAISHAELPPAIEAQQEPTYEPHSEPKAERPKAKDAISDAQRRRLYAIKKNVNASDDRLREILRSVGEVEHVDDLSWRRYKDVCDALEGGPTPAKRSLPDPRLDDIPF